MVDGRTPVAFLPLSPATGAIIGDAEWCIAEGVSDAGSDPSLEADPVLGIPGAFRRVCAELAWRR